MAKQQKDFRVGRVTVYQRGSMWYLRYRENGRRCQVRAASDKDQARQLAAQVNAQLECGAPAATSFEPINLPRWLDHHEDVMRSSVSTINRYRTASQHLLDFLRDVQPVKNASSFRDTHAESFVRYLRQLMVASNGHANAAKRRLRDKGIKYVLEVCRTLFGFAQRRRHLPPYAENPFRTIQIDRIPVEDSRPIMIFSADQERQFLEACDDWQLPIFATLMLTGLRPGELTHLLLPDDLNLDQGSLRVRNKPAMGWQTKTRNERSIPLVPELIDMLRLVIADRQSGPLFQRRRCVVGGQRQLWRLTPEQLRREFENRIALGEQSAPAGIRRRERLRICRRIWVELGVIPEARLRLQFMKLTKAIGLPHVTAPKTLRHLFATRLQEANVDPLIRNELMAMSRWATGGRRDRWA
jgi:integrase